ARQRRLPLSAHGVRPRRTRRGARRARHPTAHLPGLPERHRELHARPGRNPETTPGAAHGPGTMGADPSPHARGRSAASGCGRGRERAERPGPAYAGSGGGCAGRRHGRGSSSHSARIGLIDPFTTMSFDLNGKSALVTGGARGIGAAIVRALAGAGARVAFTYRSSADEAEARAKELEAAGVEVMAIQGDASDFSAAEEAVGKVLEKWGRLDVLVNNAGITKDGLMLRMSEADWDAVINTNLKSVFN